MSDKYAPVPRRYRFAVDPTRKIFREWCEGPWDLEFTQKYVDEFKSRLGTLTAGPWGKMCNLDKYQPAQTDAAAKIIEFLQWSIDNGLTRVAYVINDTLGRHQAERIIRTSGVAVISEFFATDEEAVEWLDRHLRADRLSSTQAG